MALFFRFVGLFHRVLLFIVSLPLNCSGFFLNIASFYLVSRPQIRKATAERGAVFAFLGIPYALPPVGNLRFKVSGFI